MYSQQIEEKKTHSTLGIISTIIGIVMIIAFVALLVLTQVSKSLKPGSMDETSPVATFTGLAFMAIVAFHFIGAVLGLIGIFQKSTKKLFPVAGAFLNLLFVFGLIALIIAALILG